MTASTAPDLLTRRLARVRATGMAVHGATAAAFGTAVFLASGHPIPAAVAGTLLAVPLLLFERPRDAARRLERGDAALDGAVLAFIEGGGGRLRDSLAAWILARRPRASYRRGATSLLVAVLAIALAAWTRSLPRAAASGAAASRIPPAAAAPYLRLSVEVTPPVYAHRPSARYDAPSRPIEALRGSTATLTFSTSQATLDLAPEGKPPRTIQVTGGEARETFPLMDSMALRIGADRVLAFDVIPDRAPIVELALPREDRSVTTRPAPFDVRAEASDDIGLQSLSLFYTLAHGHGEGMSFRSGRVDGPRPSGLLATLATRLDPAGLGLGPGDTLVMWAEATDGNAVDGPGRTASSVRILRWDEDLARLELRSSAPAVRPLNGPLSQREILARTIRLLGERLPKEKLNERSRDLAEEQGKLRAAFGFFLRAEEGNAVELDFETKEAGESGSGRARGLIAEAVSEMWSSEADLSTGNPRESLPHQRLALKKLDEAFGSERYALRALAPPKAPVDEGRRLTGNAKGLVPRTAAEAPEEKPDTTPLRALARRLLLASESTSALPVRLLADELWALPEMAHLSRASLAAPLYAARTQEESARAARSAADALLRLLAPSPVARPAAEPGLARFFTRLDAEAPPRKREARKAPAR